MKSKQHLIGVIAKKCVQLKIEKNIDAFFEFSAHVDLLVVGIYRNWNEDSNNMVFSGSSSIDGHWNSRSDSMGLEDIIENLDALLIGVGFE